MLHDNRRDAQGDLPLGALSSIDYVVAAGNGGGMFEYSTFSVHPAAFPQVLTVTAMADTDGRPGSLGAPTDCGWEETDDEDATFSNHGWGDASVTRTVAAPGVCIRSAWLGGPTEPDYKTISGTSMAAPHVTGQVALCNGEVGHVAGPCAGKTSTQVARYMRNAATNYTSAHLEYGFLHDPFHEPRWPVNYGPLSRTPPPQASAP